MNKMSKLQRQPQGWKIGAVLDLEESTKDQQAMLNTLSLVPATSHMQQYYWNAFNQHVSPLMRATSQVLNSHACQVTAILDGIDRKHSHDHRQFRWGEPSLVGVAQQSQDEHFIV